jgi:positive regulator of sigma E activity
MPAVIMHPAVLALLLGSILVSSMVAYAVRYGIAMQRHWDLRSGSERQIELEKKTYLISTVMSYAFVFQLFSLFLFIFTADKLNTLFTGAMCAAGTLNVNAYGYPTLVLKIINFVLGGAWLVMNYADNRAFDYPLIRRKYLLLFCIAPFVLAETVIQGAYFLNMKPHVITSCCGSLFSSEGSGVQGGLAGLPVMPMRTVFYFFMGLTIFLGFYFSVKGGRSGAFFAAISIVTFIVSVASLISFMSLYFYELPTHRCPFCVLQKEYHYIGYALYITLLTGVVGSAGVGVLMPFRGLESLKTIVPPILKKLTVTSTTSYMLFTIITASVMFFSDFKLEGY